MFNSLKSKYPQSSHTELAKTFLGITPIFKLNDQFELTPDFFKTLKNNYNDAYKVYNETKSKEAERNFILAKNIYFNAAKQFLKYTL